MTAWCMAFGALCGVLFWCGEDHRPDPMARFLVAAIAGLLCAALLLAALAVLHIERPVG